MCRVIFMLRYKHLTSGIIYTGVFHSEEEMNEFITSFLIPRGHILLSTWTEYN